jgi:hypothetical protein
MKNNVYNVYFEKYQVIFVSIIVTIITALFYFHVRLYIIDNHNDFGEYFVRAEYWSEGIFYWVSGSDKLLSFIELVAIKLSNINDFFDIYDNINDVITTLMLMAIFLFLTVKNSFSIEFKVRVLTILFVFSLPFFILKGRTVDQSYLFGIMLLLWVSVYHIKIISSVVALLVFTSRPEGVMIVPLFFVLMLVDRDNRKNIIINFIVFMLILSGYKLFDVYHHRSTYQEYQILATGSSDFIRTGLQKIANLLLIPVYYFILALVILKSYLYFSFFVVGTLVSLADKKYYIYFSIPILYLLMLSILSPHVMFDWTRIENYMTHNLSYFFPSIGDNNISVPLASQERYVLFLYPFISIFVVKGLLYITKKVYDVFSNGEFKKHQSFVIISVISFFSLINILYFTQSTVKFRKNAFLQQPYQLKPVGLALRKHKSSVLDSVVIYNFCDGSMGSFLSIFSVLSGVSNIYTKTCGETWSYAWVTGHPHSKAMPIYEPKELLKINNQLNFKFENANIDYKFTTTNKQQINLLFKKPDYNLLTQLSIDYVISRKKLNLRGLTLVEQNRGNHKSYGNYKIYKVKKVK